MSVMEKQNQQKTNGFQVYEKHSLLTMTKNKIVATCHIGK